MRPVPGYTPVTPVDALARILQGKDVYKLDDFFEERGMPDSVVEKYLLRYNVQDGVIWVHGYGRSKPAATTLNMFIGARLYVKDQPCDVTERPPADTTDQAETRMTLKEDELNGNS